MVSNDYPTTLFPFKAYQDLLEQATGKRKSCQQGCRGKCDGLFLRIVFVFVRCEQAVMLMVTEFWTLDQVGKGPYRLFSLAGIVKLTWDVTRVSTGATSPRTHPAHKRMVEEDSDSEDFDEALKEMNYMDISLETFVPILLKGPDQCSFAKHCRCLRGCGFLRSCRMIWHFL